MAKTSYLSANVTLQNTFSQWLTRHNQIAYDLGTVVLTAGAVLQPNTSNGAWTAGNTHLEGILSSSTLTAVNGLRGGTVDSPSTLNVVSNTNFTAAQIVTIGTFTQNFNINSNNTYITSNVAVTGASKTFTINNSRTSVSGGGFYVDAAVANFSGPAFISTSNTSIDAANVYIKAANANINAVSTFIGNNGTNTLLVNSQATLQANTTVNGIATFTSNVIHTGLNARFDNSVELGSANTDVVTLRSSITGDILPTANNVDSLGASDKTYSNLFVRMANVNEDANVKRDLNLERNLMHYSTAGLSRYESNSRNASRPSIGFYLTNTLNSINVLNFGPTAVSSGLATGTYSLGSSATRFGTLFAVDGDFSNTVFASSTGNFSGVFARDIPNNNIVVANTDGKLSSFNQFNYANDNLNVPNVNATGLVSADTVRGISKIAVGTSAAERIVMLSSGVATFSNTVTARTLNTTGAASELSVLSTGLIVNGASNFRSNVTVEGTNTLSTPNLIVTTNSTQNVVSANRMTVLTEFTSTAAVSNFGGLAVSANANVDGSMTVLGSSVVGGNTNIGSHLIVGAATNSSNTSTGSFVASGGAGIAKDLYVGGIADLGANTIVRGNLTVLGTFTMSSDISLSLNSSSVKEFTVLEKMVMTPGSVVEGVIAPSANNTYDLGTTANRFKTVYATSFTGALTGNADTATRLATARTINGVSFNGSANITLTQMPVQPSAVDDSFPLTFYGTNKTGIANNALTTFKYATTVSVNPSISTIYADHFDITSDARLKEDVTKIKGALSTIEKLQGVSFTRKSVKKKEYGVIAQDVKLVLPEVVNENSDGMLTFDTAQMNGFYIECIKELKAEIESLKMKIETRS